jgi:hypothetical protein
MGALARALKEREFVLEALSPHHPVTLFKKKRPEERACVGKLS